MPAGGRGGHRRSGPRLDRRLACSRSEAFDDVVRRVGRACDEVDSGEGILILADVHGSSPFRACLAMVDGTRPVEIVAGVNLPDADQARDLRSPRPAPGRGGGAGQGSRQALDSPRLRADRQVLDPPRRSPLRWRTPNASVQVRNRLGMHARAAVKFVQTANSFKSEVKVVKDDQEANGKSIMGLLTLVAAHGVTMTVVCDGDDAVAAVGGAGRAGRDGLRGRGGSVMEKLVGGGRVARDRDRRRARAREPRRDSRAPHRGRAGRGGAARASRARCRRATRSWRASRRRSRSARATSSSTGSWRPTA